MTNTPANGQNRLRIIAGKWRGRRFAFPTSKDLRPTPDRVRETLFNWLQQRVRGSRCLDLFAGSGALGLEALSRGASEVLFIESNRQAATALQSHLTTLAVENGSVTQQDALSVIGEKCQKPYDIIFLDPPYSLNLLPECMVLLNKNGWLADNAIIYYEQTKTEKDIALPVNWTLTRAKTAGQIAYKLAFYQPDIIQLDCNK